MTKQQNTNTSLLYGKIPPQARDLEEAILGAALLEKGAFELASEILKPECFYVETHKIIFDAMKRLYEKSMQIDLLTVVEELKKMGELENVGGAYYITQLTNAVASTASLESHCLIVLEKYMARELIRVSGEIIHDAYEDTTDIHDLVDKAQKSVFDATTNNFKKEFNHISSGIFEALKKIEELRNREYVLTGVPTGLPELDKATNGWQNANLIIIAARPSVGKSSLALNLACNAAFSNEKPTAVGIFSLEMSEEELVNRIISSETKIPLEWIMSGSLSDGKMRQLQAEAGDRIVEAPIYIDDTAGLSVFELRAKCRRLKAKHDIGLVVVDYLQLMTGDAKAGNREQEIAKISRQLKVMAKDLEIPVIALSQLSREVEKRGGEPRLSDLRESGSIENDADVVMFLWRPDEKDIREDASLCNRAFVRIAKHRNGALGDFTFYVDLSIQKWFDLDEGLEYERTFDKHLIPMEAINGFYKDPSKPIKIDDEMPF